MFNVIKRDGEVAAFQLSKITQAIEKAFQAQEKQYNTGYDGDAGTTGNRRFPEKDKKRSGICGGYSGQRGKCADPVRIF